jgi:hypothetical protein
VPGALWAACLNGACAAFPPARWESFTVDRHSGTGLSVPPGCQAGQDCTVWTLTPDGAVAKVSAGQSSSLALSAADLATVNGILGGLSFRQKEQKGFSCGGPGQPIVAFDVQRVGTTVSGYDVSLCVSNGSDPDVVRLFQVVSGY